MSCLLYVHFDHVFVMYYKLLQGGNILMLLNVSAALYMGFIVLLLDMIRDVCVCVCVCVRVCVCVGYGACCV